MKIAFLPCLILLVSCTPKVQIPTSFTPTQTFQLATPQLLIDSIIFQKTALAELELRQKGTQIRYTLDGSAVSKESLLYTVPIQLKQSGILKARAFHEDFKPSETIEQPFFKITPFSKNTKISVLPAPHPKYSNGGISILTDLKTGSENFQTGHWLGFKSKEITIDMQFEQPKTISKVYLRLLNNHRSWIFMPNSIKIYFDNQQIGKMDYAIPTKNLPTTIQNISIPINISQKPLKDLRIKIINLSSIPDFHNGKGYTPWLFIDEIWVE